MKLGIIGFGRIVELVHLPAIKKIAELEIHGIYDITPSRLELAAKRGFAVHQRLGDLLDGPCEAVLVATPPNSHFRIAAQAMERGKHVLIEKPVTETAREAEELAELAARTNRIVTVFQNRRFDADFLHVQKVLAEGELGRILFVARRHHMFGSSASFGVKSFDPDWRNKSGFGGGALLDWGVHCLDQLLRLDLGEVVETRGFMESLAWKKGDVDDFVQASFRLDSGVVLSMDINFGSHAGSPLWIVGGEKATLVVTSPKEAVIKEQGRPDRIVAIAPSEGEGQLQVWRGFAAALRGEALAVTLDEAIRTMRLLDEIRQSAAKKEIFDGNIVHGASGRV